MATKKLTYWVEYNCKYIARYKSVQACLNFISRKNLKNDYLNSLTIVDENGDEYNTINGNKL